MLCQNEGQFESRCYIKHNNIWKMAVSDGNNGFSLVENNEYIIGQKAVCLLCYNTGFSKKVD